MPVDFVPTLSRHRRSLLQVAFIGSVTEVVSSVSIKVTTDRARRSLLPSGRFLRLRVDPAWTSLLS